MFPPDRLQRVSILLDILDNFQRGKLWGSVIHYAIHTVGPATIVLGSGNAKVTLQNGEQL